LKPILELLQCEIRPGNIVMVTGATVKRDSDWCICSCGERLPLSKAAEPPAHVHCPHCGLSIILDDEEEPGFSASETQMINIKDMARMAQEGVDVGVSGEWDTSEPFTGKHNRDE
jgi:hypothetical protein